MSPSSRGLGHRVLIPATWVRIPLEMPFFLPFFSTSHRKRVIPVKSKQWLWKIYFPRHCFFFLRFIFYGRKKWNYSFCPIALRYSPLLGAALLRLFVASLLVEMPFFLPFFSTSHRKRVIPVKSKQWLWKIYFPRHCFFFLRFIFYGRKKWNYSFCPIALRYSPLGAALLRHFVAPLLVEMPFFFA